MERGVYLRQETVQVRQRLQRLDINLRLVCREPVRVIMQPMLVRDGRNVQFGYVRQRGVHMQNRLHWE